MKCCFDVNIMGSYDKLQDTDDFYSRLFTESRAVLTGSRLDVFLRLLMSHGEVCFLRASVYQVFKVFKGFRGSSK